MSDAISSVISVAPAQTIAVAPAQAEQGFSFHELLSEMNPLQYLPVVGSIYRSVTGDTIPEPVRITGSLIVSGLTGGPVGLALSAAVLALEKVTGIDPDQITHYVLNSMGLVHDADPVAVAANTPAGSEPAAPPVAADSAVAADPDVAEAGQMTGWSPAQLSAYGVTTNAGTLARGSLTGSDVLNDLMLASVRPHSSGTAGMTLTA